MFDKNEEIAKLKKLLKSASDTEKKYAKELLQYLNKWLSWKPEDPSTQSDPGNNPPPPPPHK